MGETWADESEIEVPIDKKIFEETKTKVNEFADIRE